MWTISGQRSDLGQVSITLINVFGVSGRDSERFLARWRASARIMAEQPGFVRARMYCAVSRIGLLRRSLSVATTGRSGSA